MKLVAGSEAVKNFKPTVFLNGKLVTHVIEANEELGYIIRHRVEAGALVVKDGVIQQYKTLGNVRIELSK